MTTIVYCLIFDLPDKGTKHFRQARLKKETNLTFPPPLDTEVGISPEGLSVTYLALFEVVGYDHNLNENGSVDDFHVVLHPLEKSEDVGTVEEPERLYDLLLAAGWKTY